MIEMTNTFDNFPYKAIRVEQDGPVLRVALNPSAQDSSLTVAALDDLVSLLNSLHDRPDIRVLLLSAVGDDFVSAPIATSSRRP